MSVRLNVWVLEGQTGSQRYGYNRDLFVDTVDLFAHWSLRITSGSLLPHSGVHPYSHPGLRGLARTMMNQHDHS